MMSVWNDRLKLNADCHFPKTYSGKIQVDCPKVSRMINRLDPGCMIAAMKYRGMSKYQKHLEASAIEDLYLLTFSPDNITEDDSKLIMALVKHWLGLNATELLKYFLNNT